jgi:hypothetical protein
MKVVAAPGLKVPKEDKPREYITQDEEVEVADSAYYLRRVSDGDLVRVDIKAGGVKTGKPK